MDKDLKESTEQVKKLSVSQTIICVGDKEFILNEMAIRRVKDFALKVVAFVDKMEAEGGKDVSKMDLGQLIMGASDTVFGELTDLFNWVFAYKNPDYKKVTKVWFGDNVSIPLLVEIVKAIAVQNKLDWLGPFFKGKITNALTVQFA